MTAPNIDIEGTTLENVDDFAYLSKSANIDVKIQHRIRCVCFHAASCKTMSSQKEASEQQPRYWSTMLLFSPPSYMAVIQGSPTVARLKCSNSSNSAYCGQEKRYKDQLKANLKKCEMDLQWETTADDRAYWCRTSRMGVANLERRRIITEAEKRGRRKNREYDDTADSAVCMCNVCGRICRSAIGIYSHQRA